MFPAATLATACRAAFWIAPLSQLLVVLMKMICSLSNFICLYITWPIQTCFSNVFFVIFNTSHALHWVWNNFYLFHEVFTTSKSLSMVIHINEIYRAITLYERLHKFIGKKVITIQKLNTYHCKGKPENLFFFSCSLHFSMYSVCCPAHIKTMLDFVPNILR
jgi:hypothetical protein